ncbi:MAG: ribbon-helix-helix protein, CopG family [Methanospirillaceae archaeon]|nr:ribbon-helix-helix protein, CopG family [Methanospirillaceae archaeon]
MTTSITVRVPDTLAHQIDDLANTLERSRGYLIRKAMEMYVSEYADYLIALDRMQDKDDDIISSQELRNALAVSD